MARKIRFRCDNCGKKGIWGEHVCRPLDVMNHHRKLRYDPDADLRYDYEGAERKAFRITQHLPGVTVLVGALVLGAYLFSVFGYFALGASVVLGILAWILLFRKTPARGKGNPFGELVDLCQGDRDRAERLVEVELPSARTRKEAVDRALERLRSDRRR